MSPRLSYRSSGRHVGYIALFDYRMSLITEWHEVYVILSDVKFFIYKFRSRWDVRVCRVWKATMYHHVA